MKTKIKYLISLFILLVFVTSSNVFAQTTDDYQLILEELTTEQQEMLQNEKQLMKRNRAELRATLTEEQLTILQDKTRTREQIRRQLRNSFSESQLTLVQNQERRMHQVRETFRNTLNESQRNMIRERLQHRVRNSGEQGELRNGQRLDGGERNGNGNGQGNGNGSGGN